MCSSGSRDPGLPTPGCKLWPLGSYYGAFFWLHEPCVPSVVFSWGRRILPLSLAYSPQGDRGQNELLGIWSNHETKKGAAAATTHIFSLNCLWLLYFALNSRVRSWRAWGAKDPNGLKNVGHLRSKQVIRCRLDHNFRLMTLGAHVLLSNLHQVPILYALMWTVWTWMVSLLAKMLRFLQSSSNFFQDQIPVHPSDLLTGPGRSTATRVRFKKNDWSPCHLHIFHFAEVWNSSVGSRARRHWTWPWWSDL